MLILLKLSPRLVWSLCSHQNHPIKIMTYAMSGINDTQEILVPKIEVIKAFWERDRMLWLGATTLADRNTHMRNLNTLLDEAIDLGLIPTQP